jgi:hypothetical protein
MPPMAVAAQTDGVQFMNAAARILDRLDRVKPVGTGRWMARCPAHLDRTPSLSIRETDHGLVLLHDFGGCEIGDVLAALGLELRDLFDRPLTHCAAPSHFRIPARDVLELISREVDTATILLTEAIDGNSISDVGWQRLAQAAQRIGNARDHVHGR